MPAPKSGKSNKFVLGLRDHRLALTKSESTAREAVAAGKKAVAKARKAKDYKALKANLETLARAKKSQKNLAASIKLIAKACCDQVLNCDPDFI
jgi:hypothetical protein